MMLCYLGTFALIKNCILCILISRLPLFFFAFPLSQLCFLWKRKRVGECNPACASMPSLTRQDHHVTQALLIKILHSNSLSHLILCAVVHEVPVLYNDHSDNAVSRQRIGLKQNKTVKSVNKEGDYNTRNR